ncbi:MAG: toll/interleukin-1 receptor domain-containing protein [Bacteroidetes bacterium]|nr:toll/interleukin-1 receptor domain-containing protein [Bacteroidota bacterium]
MRPIVFISYSWDTEEHKEWILKLATDLITKFGIDVLLDQYELSVGKDLTLFMESSLEKSTKVLLILTPNYKLKAEQRKGGVGFEYSMISQELFEIQADNEKFIPILRNGDLNSSTPKYIKSKIYHPMLNDLDYPNQLFELSRIIYNKPKIVKPKLGKVPDFESIDNDPILEMANKLSEQERLNNELNRIIDSEEGVNIVSKEIDNIHQAIKEKAVRYSEKSEYKFNVQDEYRKNLILSYAGFSVLINWQQVYRNTLDESKLTVSYWKGHLVLNNYDRMYFPGDEPTKQRTLEYKFDLNLNKKNVWKLKDKSTLTSDQIINSSFSYILEEIQRERSRNFRNQ